MTHADKETVGAPDDARLTSGNSLKLDAEVNRVIVCAVGRHD